MSAKECGCTNGNLPKCPPSCMRRVESDRIAVLIARADLAEVQGRPADAAKLYAEARQRLIALRETAQGVKRKTASGGRPSASARGMFSSDTDNEADALWSEDMHS